MAFTTCWKRQSGGMPVVFGPNNKRFAEAQGLLASGGGFEVSDYELLHRQWRNSSSDEVHLQQSKEAANNYVKKLSGATDKVFSSIKL